MKIIIAGGRDFNDYNFLKLKLDNILKNVIPEYKEKLGEIK